MDVTPGLARLDQALAAIDAANEDDPNTLEVRGRLRPKEQAHAEMVSEWVLRLQPEAGCELRLAARAHHVRRWEIPREDYPKTRRGYHRWRTALQGHHAQITSEILRDLGYDDVVIQRVGDILRKQDLGLDAEVQVFEDALCLTFLETQLAAFADAHPGEKARAVLVRTLRKMSPAAREEARRLPLAKATADALERAIEAADSPGP